MWLTFWLRAIDKYSVDQNRDTLSSNISTKISDDVVLEVQYQYKNIRRCCFRSSVSVQKYQAMLF